METKAHHVLVGLFAIILVAAGGFFFLWLAKVSFDQEFSEYDIVFEGPVRGLNEASEVRFNGIQVGEVTDIGLDPQNPNRVIARIRVLAQTPIRVDSFAQLEPQGLTGLNYVQLSGGSPDAPRLYSPPNRTPPRIIARQAQLEGLFEGSENVLDAAQQTLLRLSRLMSDENIDEVSQTIENIEEITAQLAEERELLSDMRRAVNQLDQTAQDISRAAESMDRFANTATGFVEDNLTPAVAEMQLAALEVNRAAVDTDILMQSVTPPLQDFAHNGLGDITLAAGDLRRLVETLERIALEIEQSPGSFIAGDTVQEVEVPR
ncbi:MlaD family protein [Maricaulis sp. D1M11]|uniref:MlaD family protein n=1 Tax=Maricaulis sp. D1M11 TaxID=3076117 RepID=UPI0039B6A3CA